MLMSVYVMDIFAHRELYRLQGIEYVIHDFCEDSHTIMHLDAT